MIFKPENEGWKWLFIWIKCEGGQDESCKVKDSLDKEIRCKSTKFRSKDLKWNKLSWWNRRKNIPISKNANCKDNESESQKMILNEEWKPIFIKEISVGKMKQTLLIN